MALERKAMGLLFWGAQMLKRITGLLVCFLPILTAAQNGAIQGHSYLGGTKAVTSGLSSVNYMDGIIPSATITVYYTGTTTPVPGNLIFSNLTGTVLGNPFTSNDISSLNPGGWLFFAAQGQGYDVVGSGGLSPNTYGAPTPLCTDCFASGGGGCSTGGLTAGTIFVANGSGGCITSPADYGASEALSYTFNPTGDFNVNGANANFDQTAAENFSAGTALNISAGSAVNIASTTSMDLSSFGGVEIDDLSASGIQLNEVSSSGDIELDNEGTGNISLDSGAGISIDDSSSTGIAIDSNSGSISLGGDMAYLFSSATPGSVGPDCLQIATTGLITNTGSTCGTINTGGTGLSASGSTLNSNAVYEISFQPGMLTSVVSTISAYSKVSVASTVDNITGSAMSLTCGTNPTITLYECGTSATCASPTTMGSVTLSATGTATSGTLSSTSIAAGDYVAWSISGGTCTVLDIDATAQIHSN